MSRARRRSARTARTARTVVDLAAAVVDAGVAPNAHRAGLPPAVVVEAYERLVVRDLGLRHLGRWIVIDAPPAATELERRERSMLTQGGRLVGFTPGGPGARDLPPYRGIVLQQGGQTTTARVAVHAPVEVAP